MRKAKRMNGESMQAMARRLGILRPLVPFAALLAMAGAMLLAPLIIIGHGYEPPDDALRHCAKAVSGRDWPDILVLNPVYTFDHHYGWHAILGCLHRLGLPDRGLLAFSVVGLFILALGLPLVLRDRGEYWVLALAATFVVWPEGIARFLLGRPYLLQTAVTLFICVCWQRFEGPRPSRRHLAALVVLTALSAWCRSTWYLYALPPLGLVLAGKPRVAGRLLLWTAVGVLAGALLTLHPWTYFRESTLHFLDATRRQVPSWMLVTEFHPRAPGLPMLLLVGGMLLVRAVLGRWRNASVHDPVFYLLAISMLLGFKAVRFTLDFGVPAMLAWLTAELEDVLGTTPALAPERAWPRLALAVGAVGVFGLSVTADLGGRYSGSLLQKTLDAQADRDWLPEPGGILYSTSMSLFYRTFYANPQAPWRYVLGFEPGMMTSENLRVYETIQRAGGDGRFYQPWVRAMRSEDRLIIEAGGSQPAIAGLDWHNVKGGIWSGRLPRQTADLHQPQGAAALPSGELP